MSGRKEIPTVEVVEGKLSDLEVPIPKLNLTEVRDSFHNSLGRMSINTPERRQSILRASFSSVPDQVTRRRSSSELLKEELFMNRKQDKEATKLFHKESQQLVRRNSKTSNNSGRSFSTNGSMKGNSRRNSTGSMSGGSIGETEAKVNDRHLLSVGAPLHQGSSLKHMGSSGRNLISTIADGVMSGIEKLGINHMSIKTKTAIKRSASLQKEEEAPSASGEHPSQIKVLVAKPMVDGGNDSFHSQGSTHGSFKLSARTKGAMMRNGSKNKSGKGFALPKED